LSHLSALRDSELLYERGMYPDSSYIFKHALTQEVAYNSLLSKKRQQTHGKIGHAIEEVYSDRLEEYGELLAHHYVRSEDKDKAVEYLDLANQKAIKAATWEDAKAYFDQALSLLDTMPDSTANRERRISLLINQAYVFTFVLQAAQYHELLKRYAPLVEEMGKTEYLGPFRACMAIADFWLGRLDRAVELADEALNLCRGAGFGETPEVAYNTLVLSHFHKGDFELVISLKDDGLREMQQGPQGTSPVWILVAASWSLWFLGRWDDAVRQAEEALRFAEKYSDPDQISAATWALSGSYCAKGDVDRAIHYGEIAVEGISAPYSKALAQMPLGWALCRAGRTSRGLDLMTLLFQTPKSDRVHTYECFAGAWLAEGYLLAGEYEKARETSERIIELATRIGAKPWLAWCHRTLGEVALKTEENQAASSFEKAISLFREMKAENEMAAAYSGMGRYHKEQRNVQEAREYLTKALEIFERLGHLIEPDKVREELAELP